MILPKYWAQGSAETIAPDGSRRSFTCWRWSDISRDDARRAAEEAARRVLDALHRGAPPGRYGYGQTPLREEPIREFADEQGAPLAAVTRNAAGVLVLSTARVMFIDIDFPPPPRGELWQSLLGWLTGRRTPSADERHTDEAVARLTQFAHEQGGRMRLYRTAAGLRGLVMHEPLVPQSDRAQQMLERLGSDPLYRRLCREQQSFRARLTPKPWRIGYPPNRIRWPWADAAAEKHFERWLRGYEQRQADYAACRFLGEVGEGQAFADAARVAELHDAMTRCHEPLPLA